MQTNQQFDLAFNLLQNTGTNLFLTGKAGTGKTTFLKRLKEVSPKRMIVVAPTGVAAINAGGVTIHSFFQLPFGPYIPSSPDDVPGCVHSGKLPFRLHRNTGEAKQISRTNSARTKSILSAVWTCW